MIDSWLLEAEAGAGAAISAAQTIAPTAAANLLARRTFIYCLERWSGREVAPGTPPRSLSER